MAISAPCGDGVEEPLRFFHGRGQIGIGKHHHFAQSLQNAVAHAVALTAVAGILNQPHLGRIGGKSAHHCGGDIARAVVHHHHLGGPAVAANARNHRAEEWLECG